MRLGHCWHLNVLSARVSLLILEKMQLLAAAEHAAVKGCEGL